MKENSDLGGMTEEQSICVTCGYCCDGTLFLHASLNPGERGSLPEKIEENSYTEGDKDYFRLPCKYFAGTCTIYDREKAYVCSSYRCQLLKELADNKVTLHDALEVVREAGEIRKELIEDFKNISGINAGNFRQLLSELGKLMKSMPANEPSVMDYEILRSRCNIIEALLIKHFRSAEDFEKMIMK